jgi:hypothetical protein
MSTSTIRRARNALIAAAALAPAALAGAPNAGAATLYACVKKNGDAHIYTKRHRCRRGETKLSWNSQGPAGRSGEAGARGEPGARGETGAEGLGGPPATTLWAVVDEGGELVRGGTGAVLAAELAHAGEYEVVFATNVSKCAYIATLGSPEAFLTPPGMIAVATRVGDPDAVYVETFTEKEKRAARSFHLAVFC